MPGGQKDSTLAEKSVDLLFTKGLVALVTIGAPGQSTTATDEDGADDPPPTRA
jgi:hypothetical protein